jgi:hypothetical protein
MKKKQPWQKKADLIIMQCLVAIIALAEMLPVLAETNNDETAQANSHHKAGKSRRKKVRHSKQGIHAYNNAIAVHPIAYPRTNFLPYGWLSVGKSQGLEQRATVNPASAQMHSTSPRKPEKASSENEKLKKTGAEVSPKKEEVPESGAESEKGKTKPPEKAPDKAHNSEKALLSPDTKPAVTKPAGPESSTLLLQTDQPLAATAAATRGKPEPRGLSLVSSVMEKMSIKKLPALKWSSFNLSWVSLLIFLSMAAFWLTMIFKALAGCKGRGMRSRLASGDGKKEKI